VEPLIIQAHLNEDAVDNPRVPMTPDSVAEDAIAVAHAGAPWVHFHARDKGGGQRPDDMAFYRDAARSFRREVDVLWHPPQGFAPTPQERWVHVAPLVQDRETALEVITIDPGSIDMMDYDATTKQVRRSPVEATLQRKTGDSSERPVHQLDHWLWFCQEARRLNLKPVFGVLEPGYLRRILTWLDMGLIDEPLVLHFFLTERYNYGLPAEVWSFETYLRMIPSWVRFIWFACPMLCSRRCTQELNAFALTRGGHMRVGLGYPPVDGFGQAQAPGNRELIEEAVAFAERFGRRPATTAETRGMLGVAQRSSETVAATATA
jgi:uncharacterized protein (DUF849 family)